MADHGNTEGLVELDIDNQEEFNRIVKREKRKLDEFLQHSTAEILNKSCDEIAIAYAATADDYDNAKASLEAIKAEKFSKKQQRKEKKAQTSFNHLKRLRDEALARLALISKQVGRYEEMFCKDPQGRTENRDQNIFKESKEAKKLGDTLVHEEAERKRAQEEKKKKRKKVVNFKLLKIMKSVISVISLEVLLSFHISVTSHLISNYYNFL